MVRAFPVAAVLVLALALTSATGAFIVPQNGIAGVRIGMKPGKVRSVLGQPLGEDHIKSQFGAATVFRYRGLQVTFQGDVPVVTKVSTTRRSERTKSGVGVGSTEAQLNGIRGLTCKSESGFRHCYLGKFRAGHRVTDFIVKRGKVTRVDVGIVID